MMMNEKNKIKRYENYKEMDFLSAVSWLSYNKKLICSGQKDKKYLDVDFPIRYPFNGLCVKALEWRQEWKTVIIYTT